MCPSVKQLAELGAELVREALGEAALSCRTLSVAQDGQVVFEYVSAIAPTVIGKYIPHGDLGQTYARLRQLANLTGTFLAVPRPIACDVSRRFLLTTKLEGKSCHRLDLRGELNLERGGAADALRRIGTALAELHHACLDWGDVKSGTDHLRELVRPDPMSLAEAFPHYAERIASTLLEFHIRSQEWAQVPPVPLHRDFHLRQLFDDGSRIGVVDWELAAEGDPAFDVAYFTAYLRTHYPKAEAEAGVEYFLSGYEPSNDLRARLPLYERFNYLRRACRRFRLRDDQWLESLADMIARL
ncbi:MAG: aminoglycoside phosphotransferase family protein [Planctomycetales bacterium]|nr:aminoglycoside phosphotransferase family protein [Planctomycetales bacterium]